MFKNLIFDWSGTLCDDLALTLDASNYVFEKYGRESLTREAFQSEFQLPYPDYYARVLPQAPLDELEDHFRYAFDHSREQVCILPHAREFMEYCRAQGIRCFALTSVDAIAFDKQCKEMGMFEYFEAIHAGIRYKEQHIHELLAQHGLEASETAFIGDMQHDIQAAKHGGITSIAVLTGYNGAAQLALAKPDMIVPDLQVLRNMIQRQDSPEQEKVLNKYSLFVRDLVSRVRKARLFPSRCERIFSTQDHQIRLNKLRFQCHIGVPDEERMEAQELCLNLRLTPSKSFRDLGDDIDLTINYAELSLALQAEAQRTPRKLIETLADDLAQLCMSQYHAQEVELELYKFILPEMESTSVWIRLSV